MTRAIFGATRAAWMFLMFAVFAFGIFLSLVLVVPFLTLVLPGGARRQERARAAIRGLLRVWLGLMSFGRLLRLTRILGTPAPAPCVMVANHPGLFDVLFLICQVPELSVLVKARLARRLPLGPVIRAMGYVLSPDAQGATAVTSLMDLEEALRRGFRVLLFPEGTRSPRGALRTFNAGALRLAARAQVPVQPVVIRCDPPFLEAGSKWYRLPSVPSLVELEFLAPEPPPPPGEERAVAKALEHRYRDALGLHQAEGGQALSP
jgi:1-acyl-sn-glycerol-3-phosphate acyltransferase